MTQYTLSDFNVLVKQTLTDHLAPSYWIVAEIGELNVNRNGHCYLDLVEKDGSQIKSKCRGTIWSYSFVNISKDFERQTGSQLVSGMKILFNASLEFHEVYGLSLNIKDIDPSFTLGEREKQKQATINQLEEDGIIDLNSSLIIPTVPQRIAVISSESAAGYEDFMNQIEQNQYNYQFDFRLFNATMQGHAAVESIIGALHQINSIEDKFDIVIMIRGGGAKTDLDCFDDYDLCAHLAQFPLPIVTGIGHERDSTISDLVANVNLKTPTAVAEYILSALMRFENDVLTVFDEIRKNATQKVRDHLDHLNVMKNNLNASVEQIMQKEKYQLEFIATSFQQRPFEIIKNETNTLILISKLIQSQDPEKILKKGFTLTKAEGEYITDYSKIKKGDIIETISFKRTIKSRVE
ncbi:MAG: exodeoxyribonuclease VII large subunit [Reichenbachiella sp.]